MFSLQYKRAQESTWGVNMDKEDRKTLNPTVVNGTFYLCLTREILSYIGFSEEEISAAVEVGNNDGKDRLEVIVVGEESPTWGPFIGVGRKGIHRKK